MTLRASHLWYSHYSEYQELLYQIIKQKNDYFSIETNVNTVLVFQPLMSFGDQRRNLPITVTVE